MNSLGVASATAGTTRRSQAALDAYGHAGCDRATTLTGGALLGRRGDVRVIGSPTPPPLSEHLAVTGSSLAGTLNVAGPSFLAGATTSSLIPAITRVRASGIGHQSTTALCEDAALTGS
jgi:hypothetical protein